VNRASGKNILFSWFNSLSYIVLCSSMACQREHDFKQTLINTLVTVLTHEFIEQDVSQISLIVEACAV
jgi:diacylglycerol kinase